MDFQKKFDLSGLQLKVLPKEFALQGYPNPDSIKVNMTLNGESISPPKWSYDKTTRSIVFEQTPAEGVSIVVTYDPAS
jgi:hypothetical protein